MASIYFDDEEWLQSYPLSYKGFLEIFSVWEVTINPMSYFFS
jgi:hypothetical protein